MLPANIEINLLPKDPFLESPLGKILQWALSAGRYLVIVTELVVVISFATRFSLDRRVTDLNSAIHQKQIIIQSYGDLEERVLTVQKKIDSFTQVEQQFNLAEAFPPLSEIVPPDVTFSQLTIDPKSVTFSGTTLSATTLKQLINNIQLSPSFSNVSIDNIQSISDKEPGYRFQMHASINRKN